SLRSIGRSVPEVFSWPLRLLTSTPHGHPLLSQVRAGARSRPRGLRTGHARDVRPSPTPAGLPVGRHGAVDGRPRCLPRGLRMGRRRTRPILGARRRALRRDAEVGAQVSRRPAASAVRPMGPAGIVSARAKTAAKTAEDRTKAGRGPAVAAPDARRNVPSVDTMLRSPPGKKGIARFGRALVKQALHATLDDFRDEASRGDPVPEDGVILARALGAVARAYYGLSEVINASGVVLHTGLGRAPLPRQAAEAAGRAAVGYSDLEVERETGGRGRRTTRAEAMLQALTGAESVLVVNNNAGALLLALTALASGKDVLVSRGELIEIGGEFRLPEIMAVSSARLVEVGTTNRTRAADYQRALGRKTGLILKVHPS